MPEPLALDADKLAACLQALAERERTVVALTFFADKSGDEVAKELSLSPGNVRVIRHRALARLRECMGGARHDGRTLRKADRARGACRLVARELPADGGSTDRGAHLRLRSLHASGSMSSPPWPSE